MANFNNSFITFCAFIAVCVPRVNAKCYKHFDAKCYKIENCHYAHKVDNFDRVDFSCDLASTMVLNRKCGSL